MTLIDATDATLAALDCGAHESALAEAVRALARAVTDAPGNASLWREYRSMLGELRAQVLGRADEDVFDALIAEIQEADAE